MFGGMLTALICYIVFGLLTLRPLLHATTQQEKDTIALGAAGAIGVGILSLMISAGYAINQILG